MHGFQESSGILAPSVEDVSPVKHSFCSARRDGWADASKPKEEDGTGVRVNWEHRHPLPLSRVKAVSGSLTLSFGAVEHPSRTTVITMHGCNAKAR